MRFEANEDQTTFLSVLDQMMASDAALWRHSPDWRRYDLAPELDGMLEENGFYEAIAEETLGAIAAVALIDRAARLPVTLEVAASSMLHAAHAPDLPRPVAVIDGPLDRATRFLPVAKSVIHIADGGVRAALLPEGAVTPTESIFAYPMGVLSGAALDWQALPVSPEAARDQWRIAIAAEITGALQGALDAVRAHVVDRRQFGRPLGSFQSMQHRLAEDVAAIEGGYWLVMRAAEDFDPVAVAAALGYVQDAATAIVYDFHQFMGAMGITLEHPLHRWSYRLRLLKSALGGASGNLGLLAERRWGAA
ncbi:acyl-CoA dehydrogenase family protein [Sinisalibacter aestuarii]|uniref:Acyl-CoA dehydrogenase/oxidase C-terminal domain-containing protein n=1 Tax=Sinisalibacter aestuarii TaxID=2949426 RepID=A0ABQ5LYD9_9RHOB|nr:acyl-CoA dehydrogenase family protein [Sinisalibacter aestuarii]GKY89971.1 hypothetical protein STA1M1_38400 [Sinisalibacter aestuarii]